MMFTRAAVCFLVLYNLLKFSHCSCSSKFICRPDDTNEKSFISYISMDRYESIKLDVNKELEKISTVNESYCRLACLTNPRCFSINMRKNSTAIDCYLLDVDQYGNESKQVSAEGWTFEAVKNSGCMACQNNATCVANMADDTGTCVCTNIWWGDSCNFRHVKCPFVRATTKPPVYYPVTTPFLHVSHCILECQIAAKAKPNINAVFMDPERKKCDCVENATPGPGTSVIEDMCMMDEVVEC